MPPKQKKAEKKAVAVAAVLASLMLAAFALAQSSVVQNMPYADVIRSAIRALIYLIGYASMVAIILLAAYGFVVYVLSPTQWYRWSALINVVEHLKWYLVGAAVFPIVLALIVYGINAVVAGLGGGSTGIDPVQAATSFLKLAYVDSFKDAFSWIFG